MRVDLHVELHVIKNSRPADSAPCFARLARCSFNRRAPSEKMSKVVDPRDTKQLFGGILYGNCPVILSFFPLSFLFPLTNLFPLTISRPPRGMSKQKKSFT